MEPKLLPQNQVKPFQVNLPVPHPGRLALSILNSQYSILSLISIISLLTNRRLAGIFCLLTAAAVLSLFCLSVSAQSGLTGFNYQAVVRKADGTVLANKNVKMRFSLLKGSASGPEVYVETQSLTSNQLGLVTHIIGRGNPESGTFAAVDFSSADLYLKVGVDLNGGSSFQLLGSAELMAVPYALYAASGTPGPQGPPGSQGVQGIQGIQGPPGADGADASLTGLAGGDLNGNYPNPTVIGIQGSPVVSTSPTNGQVLQFDGINWIPSTLPAPVGDNWGVQIAQTDASLAGDGTTANPLSLAPNGATTGQVLQYDGSIWMPSTLPTPVGDDWGTQVSQTDATLIGDGTTANPLAIAPQGAASGQVLQYDGINWTPATLPAPTGDDWGSQLALTDATLIGDGTAADPLGLAQNGAATNQVLQWDGSSWAPASLPAATGDNWGTQVTTTDATLMGDGTTTSPLSIAPQGAATGQVLKWNGTGWLPANDEDSGGGVGSGWALTGNAGTSSSSNFVGTTDRQNLIFRVNNELSGQITLTGSTALGYKTLAATTTGGSNTAMGWQAMIDNTVGNNNSAFGVNALQNTTEGAFNTSIGVNTLSTNEIGDYNSALGYQANVAMADLNNATAIGALAEVGKSNAIVLGSINGINGATSSTNVGIGTTIPDPSAVLDMESDHRGILIPRLTTAQRTGIFGPATGLLVYDTDVNSFWYFNGTIWTNISAGGGGGGTGWALTGNAGTNPATDFIGTTDVQPLHFRVNNEPSGIVDNPLPAGLANTGLGYHVLHANTTGNKNTAMGSTALTNNTTGFWNTGIGSASLEFNTEGGLNTAVGYTSLYQNTIGRNNTSVGANSLRNNVDGSQNAALGERAMLQNTTGSYNIAIGVTALEENISGNSNTAVGYNALETNTDGDRNVAIGAYADVGVINLYNAIAVGANAQVAQSNSMVLGSINGVNDASATVNVGIGTTTPDASAVLDLSSTERGMLVPRMTSTQRTVIASPATGLLVYDTDANSFWFFNGGTWANISAGGGGGGSGWALTGNAVSATDFIGTTNNQALRFKVDNVEAGFIDFNVPTANNALGLGALSSLTTGVNNTAIGLTALHSNTTGTDNTAVGRNALYNNIDGGKNTAVGVSALSDNTSGDYNTAYGAVSLLRNQTGNNNTALGYRAMISNIDGSSNTAIGVQSLSDNTSGDQNTAIGMGSLRDNEVGAGNTSNGFQALLRNVDGDYNTANGAASLTDNTSGSYNTGSGVGALDKNTTGEYNTAFGSVALNTNLTGNYITALGYGSDAAVDGLTNATAIGNGAIVPASNTMRFGNDNVTDWGFGANTVAGQALVVGSGPSNGNGAYLSEGGVWTDISDRNRKENFIDVNGQLLLEGIMQMPITRWNYKGVEGATHIGPMAQDFYRLFKVGLDNKHISALDASGIALRAIQELVKMNDKLTQQNRTLSEKTTQLENEVQQLKNGLGELKKRMNAVRN